MIGPLPIWYSSRKVTQQLVAPPSQLTVERNRSPFWTLNAGNVPRMNPFWTFCGNVSNPGRGSVVPDSSLGLLTLSTKPLASPSVPGQGSVPAPLVQVAEHALAAKSYPTPAPGVG